MSSPPTITFGPSFAPAAAPVDVAALPATTAVERHAALMRAGYRAVARAEVDAAIATMPAAYREALEKHLHEAFADIAQTWTLEASPEGHASLEAELFDLRERLSDVSQRFAVKVGENRTLILTLMRHLSVELTDQLERDGRPRR